MDAGIVDSAHFGDFDAKTTNLAHVFPLQIIGGYPQLPALKSHQNGMCIQTLNQKASSGGISCVWTLRTFEKDRQLKEFGAFLDAEIIVFGISRFPTWP